jgi:hypothetical protein
MSAEQILQKLARGTLIADSPDEMRTRRAEKGDPGHERYLPGAGFLAGGLGAAIPTEIAVINRLSRRFGPLGTAVGGIGAGLGAGALGGVVGAGLGVKLKEYLKARRLAAGEKTAGTPFLEQDRPKKVKEIYSALKREHPDMPAEMKARIAARQGKRGKQKQGPPYEGPITSKYKKQASREKTASKWTRLARRAVKISKTKRPPPKEGYRWRPRKIEGGAHEWRQVKIEPKSETKSYRRVKLKTSGALDRTKLSTVLDNMWMVDPPPMPDEKTASAYFYDLRRPAIDHKFFGPQFCKLAAAFEEDTWSLAGDVEDNLAAFDHIAKHGSGQSQELAQFYVNWADEMIEKTAFLGRLAAGAGRLASRVFGRGAAKAGTQVAKAGRTAATGTPGQVAKMTGRAVPKATRKAMRQQYAASARQRAGRRLTHQQASVRKTAPRVRPTKTPAQQARLKTTLQKRQARRTTGPRPQARPIPQPQPRPTPQPAAGGPPQVGKGGVTKGHALLGGALIGAPLLGGAAMMSGQPQQQQGVYR